MSTKNNYTTPVVAAISFTMLAIGIHQMVKPDEWAEYIPEPIDDLLPLESKTKMRLHGSGNVALGGLFLVGYRLSLVSWLVAAWWAFVLPVCWRHSWKEGVRDVPIVAMVIAIAMRATSKSN
jgi:phosphotransferase system  glucose/maltose/N-acetylglucosamine-specific IIC component